MSLEDRMQIESIKDLNVAQCNSCKHYRNNATCPAYPEGIPKAILINSILHTSKLKGQKGKYTYKEK